MFGLRSATVLFLALAISSPALAADAGSPPGPPGFRGDLLTSLSFLEKQVVSLEQAMPQAKFKWRPAKGVRSVSENYLHIAGGIYYLLGQLGREAPADVQALMKANKWESQTTNKDEIKTILTTAFAYARQAIVDTSDADLDKEVKAFGGDFHERLILMGVPFHSAEHLGLAIGYARMNGVVPPWSKGDVKD